MTTRQGTAVVVCFAALLASLTACSFQPTAGRTSAEPPDELTLDDDERRVFDARIRRDFRAAKRRRTAQLRENRLALGQLQPFPGAEVVRETQQGNDESAEQADDLEYRMYVEQTVTPYARFELLTATTWSTYRVYRLPADSQTQAVFRHYLGGLRGWRHSAREHGRSATGGHALFADHYWRDGRCVWVHIGFADQPPVPPRRTLTVATATEPARDCVGG